MILEGAVAVGAASLAALYFAQNRLVYPSWAQGARDHVDTPDQYGLPYERVALTTSDGVRLDAFDIRHVGGKPTTVLILCPNAGNIGYFLPIAELFFREFGASVFLYSYRGYGRSEGWPSERGLKLDADCVMGHLARDEFHAGHQLVLYGRSLGGANAIYIAAEHGAQCDAVILENTFVDIPRVIPHVFPVLRYVAGLCHEVWDSETQIRRCDAALPFLFLSGLRDEIVPPAHMRALYEACPSRTKRAVLFARGYHNDTIAQDGYWEAVRSFLEECGVV